MVMIQLTGKITESGKLELELPEGLPAGEVYITLEMPAEEPTSWEERPWTNEEIQEMSRITPKTGSEIVAAGHTGGWEHYGITDSGQWLEEQRRKRREQWG